MIPIYRANKIGSDKYIEFNHYFEKDDKFYAINRVINQTIDGWFTNVLIPLTQEIDITTLSISFDGGKSFIKLSDLKIYTCTDFELKYTNMKMRDCKELQSPNGSIFTIIIDKGR